MICTVYVRRPDLEELLVTASQYQNAALALVEEIISIRGSSWSCEVATWVPTSVNTFIQNASPTEVSTLTLDAQFVAVIRNEISDIILDVAQNYLERRELDGTLELVPGISTEVKAEIDAAPHSAPL